MMHVHDLQASVELKSIAHAECAVEYVLRYATELRHIFHKLHTVVLFNLSRN